MWCGWASKQPHRKTLASRLFGVFRPLSPVIHPSSTAARRELVSIQLLRALGSILVLLAHLQIKERQYGDSTALIWQGFGIGAIGVDIFFVLSGFIIFHVAGDIPSTWKAASTFMKHRFIRVVPLYWSLTAVALGVFLSHPELVNKSSSKPTDIVASFLLLPTDDKLLIQNGWTLSYELLFYFAFFLSILLLPASRRVYFALAAAVVAVLWGWIGTPTTVLGRFATDDLMLEFAFGVAIGALHSSAQQQSLFRPGPGLACALLATALIIWQGSFRVELPFVRGLRWGIPAALLLYAALSLETQLEKLRRLKILGDSSYSLYLLHPLTLPAVGMVWRKIGFGGALGNVVLLLVLFVSSIYASILLYRHFEAPLTSFLRRRFR